MARLDLALKLRRPVRLAWLSLTIACWLVAGFGAIGSTTPYLEIITHLALQLIWAAALLTIAALLLRRWQHAAFAGVLMLWQLWLVWPPQAATSLQPAAQDVRLRVIELNAWYFNSNFDDIAAYLRKSDADVIGLVEVSPGLKAALAGLRDRYPYQADCIDLDPRCEELLLSRWPIDRISAGRIDGQLPVIVSGRLHLAHETQIDIAVSHLIRPLTRRQPSSTASYLLQTAPTAQGEQAARLATRLTQLAPDAIILGDLNATPWSPLMAALRQAGQWQPETNIRPTWPSWALAPLRLPIDHVMTRGRVALISLAAGRILTSDHLPLEADIVIHGKTPE
jgi:endonuclease/exonuclease/phosphatase (EEP) superfamily protein YafD